MKRNLAQLSNHDYDVLVIGGGIYGLFVAWDAALRGLSVALVEKGDFGHATSSNTLRIIHGGLRYLQHGDIYRMRQSIHERMVYMRIAPHLVHPLPFLVPTYGHSMRGKEILFLALIMNELIGFDRNRLEDPEKHLPQGRIISREECIRFFPGVEEKGLTGGIIYQDCQMYNSERLVLAILRSAAKAGADLANYVEVTGLLRERGRVTGIKARDVLAEDELDIRARVVVNTSGPWLNQVLAFLNGHPPDHRLTLSKAFNLLVNRQLISQYAVGVYSKCRFNDRDAILNKGYRLFFITPWNNRSLIGTKHLPYGADPDNLRVTNSEIQAFLDEINEAYPAAGLKRQDICFAYSGLLPMTGKVNTAGDPELVKQYRIVDHRKEDGIDGLISVIGVKFTEARRVAEKTVDQVFTKLGKKPPKSGTAVTALHGGHIERFNDFLDRETKRKPQGLSSERVRRLIYNYGSEYHNVLRYLDSPSEFPKKITDQSLIKAELLHGIREEGAQKLTDVIFRRSELGISGHLDDSCIKTCAALMSQELGWDEERTHREIDEVRATLAFRT